MLNIRVCSKFFKTDEKERDQMVHCSIPCQVYKNCTAERVLRQKLEQRVKYLNTWKNQPINLFPCKVQIEIYQNDPQELVQFLCTCLSLILPNAQTVWIPKAFIIVLQHACTAGALVVISLRDIHFSHPTFCSEAHKGLNNG